MALMDDTHCLRLAILAALHARGRRPLTLGDLATALRPDGFALAEIRAELPGLIDHGYCENLMPGRDTLLRLTARGRDQVTLDARPDEYIRGAEAYVQ